MSTFSRVRAEHATDLISQAQMRGLEHHLLSLGEGSGWATFQFSSPYAKLSFDEMARQLDVPIEGDALVMQLDDAIDAVVEGQDPRVIHDLMVEAKKTGLTKGMQNAYNRMGAPRYVCGNDKCGATVPRYGGRYPSSCPGCGGELTAPAPKTESEDVCPKCGSKDVTEKDGKYKCNACGHTWVDKD